MKRVGMGSGSGVEGCFSREAGEQRRQGEESSGYKRREKQVCVRMRENRSVRANYETVLQVE